MNCRRLRCFALLFLAALTSSWAGNAALEWNKQAINAIRYSRTPPPQASVYLAMLHVAIYDAMNGVAPTHHAYLVTPTSEAAGANADAAAAAAAHVVLHALLDKNMNPRVFDDVYAAELAKLSDDAAKTRGIAWGESVAKKILAARADAGLERESHFALVDQPGHWRPTPPNFRPATSPHWGEVRPYALQTGGQFRPAPPAPPGTPAYDVDLAETCRLGARDGAERTEYETQGTAFWADDLGSCTPPGHWNEIAQGIATEQKLSAPATARLFALLNIALADAGIACWDAKFHHDFWRPETAIREDARHPRPEWLPLMETPSFPEFTSGHSTFSRAGAQMLTRYFGREDFTFTATSDGLPGAARTYKSLSAAVDEIGRSRIFGGIHFETANREGQNVGRAVANFAFEHCLLPLGAAR
jgi:hypothetical protein